MALTLTGNFKKFHECLLLNPRPQVIPDIRDISKKHYTCKCCNKFIVEPFVPDFFSINNTIATHWQMNVHTHKITQSSRLISEFRLHPGQQSSVILGAWKRGKRGQAQDFLVKNIIFHAGETYYIERLRLKSSTFLIFASETHPEWFQGRNNACQIQKVFDYMGGIFMFLYKI